MGTETYAACPEPPECRHGFIYTVKQGDTLYLIARRFGIQLQDLIAANPQISDPDELRPGQRICVPFPEPPACPNGFLYTVERGDTLFSIAQKFGVTVEALRVANPQIIDPNKIYPGQRICIPFPPAPACPGGQLYTVMQGDTMFSIAAKFGISLQALIVANPQVVDPNRIFPGQVLCIPAAPPPPPPPPPPECPNGFIYTVVQGDTMFRIAQRFGVSLQALIAANPQIEDPNMIFPGQRICIPVPGAPPCPNGTLYTVQQGDTMFLIAQRNNITLQALIAANPQVVDPNRIFPGQVLCVPHAVTPPPPPPPPECPNGFIYTVVQGDTMFRIAQRFGVSLQALIAANPQIEDPNMIFPGQRICIPVPGAPPCPNGTLYTVQQGDTMFLIAQRNNITLQALIAANPQVVDPNRIFPGQVLCVPRPTAPPPPPPPPECTEGFIYTVVQGDTMFRIAQRFGVTLEALIAANPQIEDPNRIVPGQRICVPRPMAPECPDGTLYTVQRGDTMFLIAQRNGITLQALIAANPQVVDPNKIFPGQVLCVPRPCPMPPAGMPMSAMIDSAAPVAAWHPGPWPPGHMCMKNCHMMHPTAEAKRHGVYAGCAYVAAEAEHPMMGAACYGMPQPSKMGSSRYYFCWAEARGGQRICFRLHPKAGIYSGDHHYRSKTPMCWVRMYVTAEKDKNPKEPSKYLMLDTRM